MKLLGGEGAGFVRLGIPVAMGRADA